MRKWFFIRVSGEHPFLPVSEVRRLLGIKNNFQIFDQVLRLRTDDISKLKYAAYTNYVCEEIIFSKNNMNSLISKVKKINWNFLKNNSFIVRIERIKNYSIHLKTQNLEKIIGAEIKKKCLSCKVSPRKPDVILRGVLVEDIFLLGLEVFRIKRGEYDMRRPRRRPFFHPSALDPRLSRCMINLSKESKFQIVLDTFCGTGSILIELDVIGCYGVGIEINFRIARGSVKNLKNYNFLPDVICGDAFNPPLREGSKIILVTDPPYGRLASTKGLDTEKIFQKMAEIIKEYNIKNCVFLSPHWVKVVKIFSKLNLKVIEQHSIRVHGSLTRRINVIKI